VAETILVIDDDPIMLQVLRWSLEPAGYQVIMASDGQGGLQQLQENHPHLVILDVMMPTMDGWETCRRIREFSTVPIIMLTALESRDNIAKAQKLGADDYVVKPFDPEELQARVAVILRKNQD
jgi:DNA-binding response OmpR family regulator